MSHITEHPSRAKRRKLDDPKPAEEINITSAAQLRELLAVQQNAPLARQGEPEKQLHEATETLTYSRHCQVQRVLGVNRKVRKGA
jgi:hypothetical protein